LFLRCGNIFLLWNTESPNHYIITPRLRSGEESQTQVQSHFFSKD
jgi:hypothetical protein